MGVRESAVLEVYHTRARAAGAQGSNLGPLIGLRVIALHVVKVACTVVTSNSKDAIPQQTAGHRITGRADRRH